MTARGRKGGIKIRKPEVRINRQQAYLPSRSSFIGSGTADTTVFLRGDMTWATPVAAGDGSHSSHQTLLNLMGGTAGEYYHLTSAQWAAVVAMGWASATHAHTISQITNLQTTLDSKASATLTLSAGQIVGGRFSTDLLGSGTATSTTYLRGDGTWATVSGSADGSMSSHQALTNLLGGTAGEYYHLTSAQWAGVVAAGWASATHNHTIAQITSLQTSLDSKASVTHIHAISDITSLQTTLDGKASVTHVHAASDITSGIFSRALLGSLSASTASFLRGTGEWTPIDWSSASHNHAASEINSGTIATARLGSGTADNTTYLRGDSTWQAIAGATPYIERFSTATCSAAAYITYQHLNTNQTASQSNSFIAMFTTLGVGAGTWNIQYHLIYETAATTTGIGARINHTGASPTHFVATSFFVTTGGAAATGVADQVQSSQTAGLIEGKGERALNTMSSFTVGVDTASSNCHMVYSGILVAANTGTLTLNVASEVNGSNVVVKAGSHLILQKIA